MPVPASGELKLRADIALEVDGSASGTNVSLGTLSDTAGFDTPPDAMSEFYGYVSYTQPTFSGTPSTSNVFDVRMDCATPTYSNPSGGSIEYGWYFGTSTTATSNTFYSQSTSSSTGQSYSKQFTGLSGSTTYRIWGVLRDTQSPARFTETITSMKSQATQAAVSYTTTWGGAQNLNNSELVGGGGNVMTGTCNSSYNHIYYGWTSPGGGYSTSLTDNGGGAWQGYASAPNVSIFWGYRSGYTNTQNRMNQVVGWTFQYDDGGGACVNAWSNHSIYSIPNSGSSTLQSIGWSGQTALLAENWVAAGSASSGGYTRREVCGNSSVFGNGSITGYMIFDI